MFKNKIKIRSIIVDKGNVRSDNFNLHYNIFGNNFKETDKKYIRIQSEH